MTPLVIISGIAFGAILISHATTRPRNKSAIPDWILAFALLLAGILLTTYGAANARKHYAWHLATLSGSVLTLTSIANLYKKLK